MCTTMEGLWIAVATCVFVSCSVKGYEYPWNYEEHAEFYPEDSFKETWTARKRHPLFQCPDMSPSRSVPTSVEFVKPADIKVIAALGDSLTAANGALASTVLGIGVEFRQVSWSAGGYKTYQDDITLPNILKLFNPSLIGASSGKTIPFLKTNSKLAGLNLSVAGATSSDLPKQTKLLIGKLRRHEGLNFKEDWKLLTILIGMNDICSYCDKKALFSADNFIHFINLSLEMLMDEVPRMIVNVVQLIDMQLLREIKNYRPPKCIFQRFQCPCMLHQVNNSPQLQEVIGVNMEYQNRLEEHLNSDRFFKKDFAVVLQPFLKHADLPRTPDGKLDLTFFAPDCYHLSAKGHEKLAKGLWNNMFQPVGKKSSHLSYPIRLMCPPVEHPYIYTRPQRKHLEYTYK